MNLKFGDKVVFNAEYASSKANTLNIQQFLWEIEEDIKEKNIELSKEIQVKKIKNTRDKEGIFLGKTTTHLSVCYGWEDSIDVGTGVIPERYTVETCNFIEVGKIAREGINKIYLVPLENIRKLG